jgi:hypothetical protein
LPLNLALLLPLLSDALTTILKFIDFIINDEFDASKNISNFMLKFILCVLLEG